MSIRVSGGPSSTPHGAATEPALPANRRFSARLGEAPVTVSPSPGAPAAAAAPPAASVAAGPLGAPRLRQAMTGLISREQQVDRALERAMAGGNLSPEALLALQARVLRYSQELDVASKLVEKVTSGVKQTLQTQV